MQNSPLTKLEGEYINDTDQRLEILEQYRLYGADALAPLMGGIDLGETSLEEFISDLETEFADLDAE